MARAFAPDALRAEIVLGSRHESAPCVRQTCTTREHLPAFSSANQLVRIAVALRSKSDAAAMAGKPSIFEYFWPAKQSNHFRVATPGWDRRCSCWRPRATAESRPSLGTAV